MADSDDNVQDQQDWVSMRYTIKSVSDDNVIEESNPAFPFVFRLGIGAVAAPMEKAVRELQKQKLENSHRDSSDASSATFNCTLGEIQSNQLGKSTQGRPADTEVECTVTLLSTSYPRFPTESDQDRAHRDKVATACYNKCLQYKEDGNFFFKQKDHKEAKRQYIGAIKSITDLLAQLDELANYADTGNLKRDNLNQTLCSSRNNLSLCYLKLKEYKKCANQCNWILNNVAKNSEQTEDSLATQEKALFRLGSALFGLQEFDQAIDKLDECLCVCRKKKDAPTNKEAAALLQQVRKAKVDFAGKEKKMFQAMMSG
eukprot:TRINITY_DN59646_c0_g1_i1.p1 TRINITY_DN59646_c0_g1~~TRINITY_DN59646_c0_g1_i1.p1  ORF type:complete len:315 (+),score=47.35 TRINITY_DN59646_c0_g1_i1:63-1007(+)